MTEIRFRISKLTGATLFLFIAIALQVKFAASFAWTFDFLIVAALLLHLFLTFSEFIFFYGLYALIFSGLLVPGGEKTFLLIFPIVGFLSQNFFPWQSWFSSFFMSTIGIGVFYILISAHNLGINPSFMLFNLAISSLFGWAMFLLMRGFERGNNI